MPRYNFRYLTQVEERLQEFGQIAEANSINPQTVADLLGAVLQEVDDIFAALVLDGSAIQVLSRVNGTLVQHLNSIYDKL